MGCLITEVLAQSCVLDMSPVHLGVSSTALGFPADRGDWLAEFKGNRRSSVGFWIQRTGQEVQIQLQIDDVTCIGKPF